MYYIVLKEEVDVSFYGVIINIFLLMLSVTKSKRGKYEDGSGKECMVPKKQGGLVSTNKIK